jgi:hypothetical protein|tara:strand:- start:1148 stop:1516 length:369 start_codon:yes stop_codon:yes gene_type:complete
MSEEYTESEDLDYVSFNMLRLNDNAWPPEQLMWLAVIAQAILDATKEPRSSDSDAIVEYRRSATRWLTTVSACVTAEDRHTVCEFAGIAESQIRRLSTNVLFHGQPFERFRINALLDTAVTT